MIPGRTPCLACLYPTEPPHWKREFPVFGAVAGVVGCLGAVEIVKVLAGVGEPLLGRMLLCDLGGMTFQKVVVNRRPDCPVCAMIRETQQRSRRRKCRRSISPEQIGGGAVPAEVGRTGTPAEDFGLGEHVEVTAPRNVTATCLLGTWRKTRYWRRN